MPGAPSWSQASTVHPIRSLQAAWFGVNEQPVPGPPNWLHASIVQLMESVQFALFGTLLQAPAPPLADGLQESFVQAIWSLQLGAVPGWQVNVVRLQVSAPLQN